MKLSSIIAIMLLTSACKKSPVLELSIKAPAIADGVVILKQANEITLNEPFKNGMLTVSKHLQSPGYYNLSIIDNNQVITARPGFDVYLENGTYTIEAQKAHEGGYPVITTSSATQKELSDYYRLADGMAGAMDGRIDSLTRYLKTAAAAKLSKQDRANVYANTRALQKKRRELDLAILKKYTEANPKNRIAAHIMNQQDIAESPTAYNAIFQKFDADLKTSDDGLKISNKLTPLLGVITNAAAPAIVGNTPDGKPFYRSMPGKKLILAEFWKASSSTSRALHQRLVQGVILTPADKTKLGIVSVSIDDNRAVWLEAIKKEHKAWLDVSDLKGDNSPNVNAWNIKAIPAFFLLDKNWHIVKSNVNFDEIDTEVHAYLQKHR